MRVAVIGLGAMGGSVAARLARSELDTRVYDIDRAAVARAVAEGATEATLETASDVDVVVTSLPNDAIVRSVLLEQSVLERLTGKLLIELSTILPETMREVAAVAKQHSVAVVDSPVSGGPAEARSGKLVLLVGADDAALANGRPVLEQLGEIKHVGPVGSGKAIKLVNNLMSMGNMVVAAEAFALGERMGLDPRRMFEVLRQSGGSSHHLVKRVPYALDNDYAARFAVDLAEKDLRLAISMGGGVGYDMPVAAAVRQVYADAQEQGFGREDMVSVLKVYGYGAEA